MAFLKKTPIRLRAINRNSLDFIEAAAGRNEAAGHAQRVDRTMLLDRSHASPVGFDAACDLDLARRTAGLDAEGDGRERDHDALDQRRTGAAERLDATVNDEPADRLADLNADCPVGVCDERSNSRDSRCRYKH